MHFSLKARLMRRWRILTISPGHIHGNYFCWGFTASFIACIWTKNSSALLNARCCCGTLNTIERKKKSEPDFKLNIQKIYIVTQVLLNTEHVPSKILLKIC